eukprot:m.317525 g.317525  ORF g.317525 m.317525 type:complete len:173 (+) comp16435_c0_seq3:1016-1534(+)
MARLVSRLIAVIDAESERLQRQFWTVLHKKVQLGMSSSCGALSNGTRIFTFERASVDNVAPLFRDAGAELTISIASGKPKVPQQPPGLQPSSAQTRRTAWKFHTLRDLATFVPHREYITGRCKRRSGRDYLVSAAVNGRHAGLRSVRILDARDDHAISALPRQSPGPRVEEM